MELEFEGTDRFEVIARLGEGAMGVVYRAIDREKAEPVAIKTLRHLDGDGLLRFKNEFRAIQSLQHANVISLGELVEARGRWFFTMELIEGTDFYSWVRPRRPRATADQPPSSDDSFAVAPTARTMPAWMNEQGTAPAFDEDRLRLALRQLVQGVAALHHTGLVHRDIKPSNVLVSRDGRVVLLDFGFVVAAEERSSDRIVGTVAYMSPEQAASLAPSPASDWYSVGVMIYEALTGRPPIDGTPIEILMGKQHLQPVPPSQVVTGVPIDLEELCLALLRVRPDERPGEAEESCAAWAQALFTHQRARPSTCRGSSSSVDPTSSGALRRRRGSTARGGPPPSSSTASQASARVRWCASSPGGSVTKTTPR